MRVVEDFRWSFRSFPDALRELRIRPVGLLHVGAHHGEEVPLYLLAGLTRITLVEPDPENCAIIAGKSWIDATNIGIVRAACGPERGAATFHRAQETPFSGLARDDRMPETATFSVDVMPVRDLQGDAGANILVVDTQGTEIEVLRSASVESLDLIVVEAQTAGANAPGAHMPDLLVWCREVGWIPRIMWRRDPHWGDVLLTPRRGREELP